jgi:hypothetical protein
MAYRFIGVIPTRPAQGVILSVWSQGLHIRTNRLVCSRFEFSFDFVFVFIKINVDLAKDVTIWVNS